MFKLLLVALSAVATQAAYTYNWAPFSQNPNDYFNFEMGVVADAQYTTTYTSQDSHEEYGLAVQSGVDVTMMFEFISFYSHVITFHIVPLKLVPYNQNVDYDRPSDHDGNTHSYLSGFREIQFLDIQTEHKENMKTCTASLYDSLANTNTDYLLPKCTYNAKTLSRYMDSVWHWNLGQQVGLATSNWYGNQQYYNQQAF